FLPMAFCFPGYDTRNADLPPPRRCADHWRDQVMASLPAVRLTFVIGSYAQRWHLGPSVTDLTSTVAAWRRHLPDVFPLPHPSWRNSGWLKRNPWFEADLVPAARRRVKEVLADVADDR
ncbi:MAG: uracil-DNA glycosylase family protein, partial [Paracoccaceae bacterium]